MRADDDLPWYFGTGSKTLAGDAGLCSTLGRQVAFLESASPSKDAATERRARSNAPWLRLDDPRWAPEKWQDDPKPQGAVDVSSSEDAMIDRMVSAPLASEIEARLGVLSDLHVRVLRMHYSGESLPFELDPAAVLLDAARRACKPVGASLGALREVLKKLPTAEREAMSDDAKALVKVAQEAYEAAPAPRGRRLQVNDPRGRRPDVDPIPRAEQRGRCASGKLWYEDL